MTDVMLSVVRILCGVFLASTMFTLAVTVIVVGDLRRAVWIWNDAWWYMLTLGRWNRPGEETDE